MSDPIPPTAALRHVQRWQSLGAALLVSSTIAVLMTVINQDPAALPSELLISNLVGICIWALMNLLVGGSKGRIAMIPAALIAVPSGLLIGGETAARLGMPNNVEMWLHDPMNHWKSFSVSLMFAFCAGAFVIVFLFASQLRLELESERRRSAEIKRSQAVAELALLQAQIEPHFLFNTLAHVHSAIEQDPALGKMLLEHLIRHLRGTLLRSRVARYSLAEEQELVGSLLAIAALRLGNRLQHCISIDPALRDAQLPPLLLQPLVENAIKHGIETAVQGGEIWVEAHAEQDMLVMRVTDTGVGIVAGAPEGVGLANVRSRLLALYGDQGRLTLQHKTPHGVVAELRLPLRRA